MKNAGNSLDDKLYDLLWTTARLGQNMLLHGPGGTGKTYLLRKLAKRLTDAGFTTYCTLKYYPFPSFITKILTRHSNNWNCCSQFRGWNRY